MLSPYRFCANARRHRPRSFPVRREGPARHLHAPFVSGQTVTFTGAAYAVDTRPDGSRLGADLLPQPSPHPAGPIDTTPLTSANVSHAGKISNRTSFGTKRSWVQIPPPRQ